MQVLSKGGQTVVRLTVAESRSLRKAHGICEWLGKFAQDATAEEAAKYLTEVAAAYRHEVANGE